MYEFSSRKNSFLVGNIDSFFFFFLKLRILKWRVADRSFVWMSRLCVCVRLPGTWVRDGFELDLDPLQEYQECSIADPSL